MDTSIDKDYTVVNDFTTFGTYRVINEPDYARVCGNLPVGRENCELQRPIPMLSLNITTTTSAMKVRANIILPPSNETLHTNCTISFDTENPNVDALDPSFRHTCVGSWACKGGFVPGLSKNLIIPNLTCNSSAKDDSIFAARAVLTAVGPEDGKLYDAPYVDAIGEIGIYIFHSVHTLVLNVDPTNLRDTLTTASMVFKTQHNARGESKCDAGCSYVVDQNATTDSMVLQTCVTRSAALLAYCNRLE